MSFGIRIWDENGNLTLDETSLTMRVVYSGVVTGSNAKTFQTISVPGLTPTNGTAFVVPIGGWVDGTDKQLETEVISGAVRVYSYIRGSPYEQYTSTTSSTMRLIVIRFS